MSVVRFDRDRPRRPKREDGDVRQALADLVAFAYADDLTVRNRASRHNTAVRRARDLLTGPELDAAMNRMFEPEAPR